MPAAASACLARNVTAAAWTRGHWPARKPGQGSRVGARRARPCFHSAARAVWSAAGAGVGLRPNRSWPLRAVMGSSLLVAADNGPMQGLPRSPALPLPSGVTLRPLGRLTGLLGPALLLLGLALLAFGRFARQPLGGQALLQGAPGCRPFGPTGLARGPQGFLSGSALASGWILDILDGSPRLELLQHGLRALAAVLRRSVNS